MADGVSDAGAGAPIYDWQDPSYRSFELGDVFGRAMRALGKHFVPLSLIAIPLVFLPNLVVSVLPYIGLGESVDFVEVLSAQFSLPALIATGIVLIVGAIIAPAAMVFLLVRAFNGDTVSAMESLRVGLSRFWVLIGVGVLMGLAMMLAAVLLIFPALILYSGWFVVSAIVVMERRGVTGSLSRSWELSNGHKWLIFVIIIATFVVSGVLAALATLFLAEPYSMDMETGEFTIASQGELIALGVANAVAATLGTLFSSALIASAYRELRVVKDGADASAIWDIFG